MSYTLLMPEPEKVNPLVFPMQKGDNLLGLPTVWWPSWLIYALPELNFMSHAMLIFVSAEGLDELGIVWEETFPLSGRCPGQDKHNLKIWCSVYRPSLILIWLIGNSLIYLLNLSRIIQGHFIHLSWSPQLQDFIGVCLLTCTRTRVISVWSTGMSCLFL